jgi:hypothetical protein
VVGGVGAGDGPVRRNDDPGVGGRELAAIDLELSAGEVRALTDVVDVY